MSQMIHINPAIYICSGIFPKQFVYLSPVLVHVTSKLVNFNDFLLKKMISVSNSLDQDQTRHFVEPDLGLNQKLSTDVIHVSGFYQ